MPYFTEREFGLRPRTSEAITLNVWQGVVGEVSSRISDGSFAYSYPKNCPDGRGPYATDDESLGHAVRGLFPEVGWPLYGYEGGMPPGLITLDLVEFCHDKIALPVQGSHHDYYGHYHLEFDVNQGRARFRETVNHIFSRNGLAFNLEPNGLVVRLAPPVLSEALLLTLFRTGDDALDSLLETARKKFLNHDPEIRKEALEKLWDAFERLKTLEISGNKRASVEKLLMNAVAEENLRRESNATLAD